MRVNGRHYGTVWLDGKKVRAINQRLLPYQFKIVTARRYTEVAQWIKTMAVRGAGCIGVTAGLGVALACLNAPSKNYKSYIARAAQVILKTRPTAVNLSYAVTRVMGAVRLCDDLRSMRREAVKTAIDILKEDAEAGRRIGEIAQPLIKQGAVIQTHCNAGWLAFADWGTALSCVYAAKRMGKNPFVIATETRPRSQGSKLTSWELGQEKIPHVLIADTAAGYYMKSKKIDLVIVGADRIARNGDVANKIGTYTLAVLAREHRIPFYVAAPLSTFDLDCAHGDKIPIERRSPDEVLEVTGPGGQSVRIAPKTTVADNPAFDVTPARYIRGIITEKGIVRPNSKEIGLLFRQKRS